MQRTQGHIQSHPASNLASLAPEPVLPNLCPLLLPAAARSPSTRDVRWWQEAKRELSKTGIQSLSHVASGSPICGSPPTYPSQAPYVPPKTNSFGRM